MATMLLARDVPPRGGDTLFANMHVAYERLSDGMKHLLDGVTAVFTAAEVHGKHGLYSKELAKGDSPVQSDEQKAAARHVHPVIRTHPETGRRAIYTNRAFVSHIEGVSAEESEEILDRLERAILNPSVQCRIRWQKDTFVMWDNRAVQHNATDDFWPQTRHVERVTIVGDRPV